MTIDEAIELLKKHTKCMKNNVNICVEKGCGNCKYWCDIERYEEAIKCIPAWLEELKNLRGV